MDCREMQLTNAEIDNTEAIKESMKNGVGYGDGWEERKVLFNRSLLIMQQL